MIFSGVFMCLARGAHLEEISMKIRAKRLAIAMAAIGMGSLGVAHAGEGDSMFAFSGFGTVGVTHSNSNQADFSSTVFHPNGAGATHSVSADVDTKFGLQVNGNFSENFTGVVQMVSQQGYDNSYTPNIEWANLSYKVTNDLKVRVGRTVWPLLLRSETQNVGYGNPFVRNTTEHLANMPNTFSDGVDVTLHSDFGAVTNSVQLLYGNSDVNYPGSGTQYGPVIGQNYLHVKNINGVSDVLEYGDLKVHAAYMKLAYDWLYYGYKLVDVPYTTWSLGFNYDPGNWFVTSDMLKAFDESYGNFTALMVGGGYRIGDWTPYALYSSLTQDSLGSLGSFGSNPGDKQTVTAVGVRWDFMRNMDFKLQYEQVRSGPISQVFPSSLTNWQSGFLQSPNADVTSAVVDFVF
jgi:hypothetical protein